MRVCGGLLQNNTILRTHDQILIEGGAFPLPFTFRTIETHYPKEKAPCVCVCALANVDAERAVVHSQSFTFTLTPPYQII